MANRKKTIVEEDLVSTNEKGITKIDTTRTQKIIAKTKVAPKHTPATTLSSQVNTQKGKKEKKNTDTTKSAKHTRSKETTSKKKKTTTPRKTRTKTNKKDAITANTPLLKSFDEFEYYDLPYTYNKTVVKILAQTPETLFVYWDISEEDKNAYIQKYGPNFFTETKPVLIIKNKTMDYSFEIDVNDFANSWYFHVNDAKCEYDIELGRRPISKNISIPNNYVYVASSNNIEAPNNHILFEKRQNVVYFKNVKTNIVSSTPITKLSLISNMGKIYNIYDVYKKIYKDENFVESTKIMGNSSSVFK